jgi:NAD(P)-dependent dehydrogenase (short-subunit alcohol dehydrogenase family)
MGALDGKVAFISGGAPGQGRSHAVRLAREGADIITFDICAPIASVAYAHATEDDLNDTVKAVETLDRRIVAHKANVRDPEAVQAVLDEGLAELGRVDIVLANAGIMPVIGEKGAQLQAWHDGIDVLNNPQFLELATNEPSLFEAMHNVLPINMIKPIDVSNAILHRVGGVGDEGSDRVVVRRATATK